jgi:uncharacterized protein (DUF885 family)
MRKIALLLCTTMLASCGPDAPNETPPPVEPELASLETVQAESARFNEWADAEFEAELQESPIYLTYLGRKERYDEIDQMDEAAEDARMERVRARAEALRTQFDRDLLSPEARTSYDLWLYQAQEAEDALPFRRRSYVFNQMQGPQAQMPNFLINFHRVDTEADMTAYIRRIEGVGRAIGQLTERARRAVDEGVRPPRFAYEGVLEQSRNLLQGAPFGGEGDSPLFADAKAKIAALEAAGEIGAERAEELRAEARRALIGSFQPAYNGLIAFVEGDLPNTTPEAEGVGALPDGEAYYANQLRQMTTTDLSADEVHEIGLAEVARIRGEMEAIKAEVGFEGSLQEFFEYVRSDDRFYYPNTDEGREAYLEAARDHLAFIDERLPDYFGLLPKAGLVVKRVEAFREEDGGAQHYNGGTPDGSRPGTFYAHLSDMKAMPIPQLEVIAYHEGNPGHHMQISIAQELEGVPQFRTQAGFGAYQEGWALYSELLAKEMGAYADPYSDFGRLTTEIWRAIRLVVDTGMHAKGWSEEEAVAYFTENSPAAEGQIRSEIRRYLVWPGQATGYKIGMLKILELRAEAEAALGDQFDIRGFHDAVLGGGALPLDLLEGRVDEWVEGQQAA